MSTRELFVYGSLKRGFVHHHLLDTATFHAETATATGYYLVRFGAYPALVEGGEGAVRGERYLVDEDLLATLDEFEGPEYERRAVRLASGATAEAYFARCPSAELERVPGSSWDRS